MGRVRQALRRMRATYEQTCPHCGEWKDEDDPECKDCRQDIKDDMATDRARDARDD